MWGRDGQSGQGGQSGSGPKQSGQTRPIGQPGRRPQEQPDVLEEPRDPYNPYGDVQDASADAWGTQFFHAAPDVTDDFWRRMEARRTVREFLGSVPRTEPEVVLSFINPHGNLRTLTRAQLSAAVDRLRPRQRQIVRLAVEERWPRQRVCEYLNHISIKTFERDHLEALDVLAEL